MTPRIPPLAPADWPPTMGEAIAALAPPNARHDPPISKGRPKAVNALGTFAHHPDLARAFHGFNGHILLGTTLSVRQRELVILRVAARRRSDYEWAQHLVLAGDAGLDDDEIARVADGSAEGWSALDAALLRAVDELLADARVADDTWSALAEELDVQQLMDLVFTVGAYDLVAMAFRTFGVELDDDLQQWLDARERGGT